MKTDKALKDTLWELLDDETYDGFSYLDHYTLYTLRERAIYQNMNKMEASSNILAGYFWTQSDDKAKLQEYLDHMERTDPSFQGVEIKKVKTDEKPPTRFLTNYVIHPSQLLVDTYGTPRYGEVNPAVFTVATFPYLFGVMFGDMGHGGLLLAFAIYIMLASRSKIPPNGIVAQVKPFRAMLLGMGFFAFYCGLIYNEFFGMSTPLFGSCYHKSGHKFHRKSQTCVHPVGIDPVWGKSSNDITSANSFKMKLSIIVGVFQMCLGICLKGLNSWHFKDWAGFFFEFIPQLLFFLCTFGYLCILIVLKWAQDWTHKNPPILINAMINMVSSVDQPLIGDAAFQLGLQRVLVGKLFSSSDCCRMRSSDALWKSLFLEKQQSRLFKRNKATFISSREPIKRFLNLH